MLDIQVMVHLLQCLQTLGQVLVVDLLVKHVHVLLTQPLGTEDVEPGTFLQQLHRLPVDELLLGDVLEQKQGIVGFGVQRRSQLCASSCQQPVNNGVWSLNAWSIKLTLTTSIV